MPELRLASTIRCRWPKTSNCGNDTSGDIWTLPPALVTEKWQLWNNNDGFEQLKSSESRSVGPDLIDFWRNCSWPHTSNLRIFAHQRKSENHCHCHRTGAQEKGHYEKRPIFDTFVYNPFILYDHWPYQLEQILLIWYLSQAFSFIRNDILMKLTQNWRNGFIKNITFRLQVDAVWLLRL